MNDTNDIDVGGFELSRYEAHEIERQQDEILDAPLSDLPRILEATAVRVPEQLGLRTAELGKQIASLVTRIEVVCAELPEAFFRQQALRRMRYKPFPGFIAHLDASMRRSPDKSHANDAAELLRKLSEELVQLTTDICLAKIAASTRET